jgi:hypothetical protein
MNPTLNEFLNRPIVYSNAFKYNLDNVFPETFDISIVKGEPISFQFTTSSNDLIDHVELYCKELNTKEIIARKSNDNTLQPSESTQKEYKIDQIFTTRGTHIVHILVNNSYAFTYAVNVR